MNQIRLYNILRKDLQLSDDKAADFVSAMGTMPAVELNEKMQTLATKNDIHSLDEKVHSMDLKLESFRADLYRVIFLNGIVQFIAIVGSVLAIVKFMR
jgi:hypothetical protein